MARTDKLIDRVMKLVALSANNPSEAESAAAGRQACALMYAEHLSLVDSDEFEELCQTVIEQAETIKSLRQPAAKSAIALQKGHKIVSKFDGACKGCGDDYYYGDRVYWRKGLGCWHLDCVED